MIYITGDTHGNFERIAHFCARMHTKPSDIMILLGDAGINFYGGWRDQHKKEFISTIPITLFCIHGNHERRPATIPSYTEIEWHGGTVYVESQFPSIAQHHFDTLSSYCKRCCESLTFNFSLGIIAVPVSWYLYNR